MRPVEWLVAAVRGDGDADSGSDDDDTDDPLPADPQPHQSAIAALKASGGILIPRAPVVHLAGLTRDMLVVCAMHTVAGVIKALMKLVQGLRGSLKGIPELDTANNKPSCVASEHCVMWQR